MTYDACSTGVYQERCSPMPDIAIECRACGHQRTVTREALLAGGVFGPEHCPVCNPSPQNPPPDPSRGNPQGTADDDLSTGSRDSGKAA